MSSDPSHRREFPQILRPTLQIGSLFGITGLLVGGTIGLTRARFPIILAAASGIQWFVFGASFSASRSLALHAGVNGPEQPRSRDKILASSIAGAIAGSTAGSLRGLRSIIPGGVLFAIVGAAGQKLYNVADARHNSVPGSSGPQDRRSWLNSRWSPIKRLSDEEYEKMLQEKLLRINAEISIVDESITRERNTSTHYNYKSQDSGDSKT